MRGNVRLMPLQKHALRKVSISSSPQAQPC
jgi:hypothetical protein